LTRGKEVMEDKDARTLKPKPHQEALTREMEVMEEKDAEDLGVPRGATALKWGGSKAAKKGAGGADEKQSIDEWMREQESKANDAGEM
jgi:hypothetical protein